MPKVVKTKPNKDPAELDDSFIPDEALDEFFIPDPNIAQQQLPPTDTFAEVLTNPVEAGKRAEETLKIAAETGRSVFDVERDFQWTPERVDEVKKRFGRVLNPLAEVSPLWPPPVDEVAQQVALKFWWRDEGQFLPPEVLTELGIEGGEKVPTTVDLIQLQKKIQSDLIKGHLNIKVPKEISEDPLQDMLTFPTGPADPTEPPADALDPKTADIIKYAAQEDVDFLAEYVKQNPIALPDNVVRAINDEVRIREIMPKALAEIAEKPFLIVGGTGFFDSITLGSTGFAHRKGVDLFDKFYGVEKGEVANVLAAVARVREQIAREDPRLLTQIGLSSGSILADIIKFTLLPDVSKVKAFTGLSKAAKSAIGIGTKSGLINLLQAPKEGETFNERVGSVTISTGTGAIAGAVFSLALSGLSAIGSKISTKIDSVKTELIRKALIKRSPKLEGYLKTLDETKINSLRTAVNDSVQVQVGNMTQATWDSNHKSFMVALAKDAIRFTSEQTAGRSGAIVPQGFRAAFAEIGPTEPSKRLAGKAVREIGKHAAVHGPKFAIESVTTKKSNILKTGSAKTKEALTSVEDYLSRIKITETDRLELPDKIFTKVTADLSKEFKISQSEAIARVFDETLTKLSRPEGKKWLEIVKDIQKDIGASDLDAARMLMIGTKGTKFSPLRAVRTQLAKERKQAGGIKKLPPGVKVLSEIMNGPKGEEASVLAILETSKGMPLPIRTNAELSFRRMAESVGDIRRVKPAWPLSGSKRPTGPNKDVIFELPEDTVLEYLKNQKAFSFDYQGEKIEIGGSPLTTDQITEIERLEAEAVRLNVDPFAYVWENFLEGFQKSLGVKKDTAEFFWNQAVKMHTQAATRLWEQREALRVKANPELLEKGVSFNKERSKWEAFVNFPESDKRTNLGRFGTKEEAMAARKKALIDRFGKDYSGFDLRSMPRESAWGTFAEEKARLKKIDLTPKIITLGDTNATQETSSLIEKHSKASYVGENTAIAISPGKFPAKPTKDVIIADKGKDWYDDHKNENIQIVGRTFFDRDSGRLTHEVFSEGTGQAGTLAEEIYHPVFDIIGETAPDSFEAIRSWHADRPQRSGQNIDEDFAEEMALIETYPKFRSDLPKDVIKLARDIMSGKAPVSQDVMDKVKSRFTSARFGIEPVPGGKKPQRAPAAAKGEPRTLPESRTEQLIAENAALEKWRQEVLSKPETVRDPAFAEFLEKEIAKNKVEIKKTAAEKEKVTKLLGQKTFEQTGRSLPDIAKSAAKNMLDIAKSVPKMIIEIFEPAKLAQVKLGDNVYSTVIRGISLPDVRALEFNEQVLDVVDTNFGELEKFFDKFSKEDLKNFMLSRGTPRGEFAKEFQKEASVKLPEPLKEPGLQTALQEIADFNYNKLVEIAEGDITKVRDYFYGIYDQSPGKIDKFLDQYYRTTKRFLKEKSLPTVADAKEYGLTLKSNNPVTNLKSEWSAISRLEGMQMMRDDLLKFGKGEFIDTTIKAQEGWVKIGTEPVFDGLRADENLAMMINKLISANKTSQYLPLRALRGMNNVLRIFKFAGSAFHLTVEASQAIADTPYLNPASALRGFTTGFRTDDPVFKTAEYKDYIALGGSHRTSIEAQAQNLFNEIITALGKPGVALKTAILPLRIVNMFTEWMFNSYIPKLKYTKYLDFVADQERKLGRGLTDGEKIAIIKEGQNFYGEMNEKLFGRSSTATSILRFIFLAPGFAEGNYRTIAKGATQWGIGDSYSAARSRRNVVNSLLLKAIAASIGTMILTGKPPKKPKNAEDVRDLFKIDTGKTDDRGRKVFIDTLTYDKDYYNLLLGWAQHGTVSLGKEILRRVGGMTAPFANITYDLATMVLGSDIYDWKGDRIIEPTDSLRGKLRTLALYELEKIEPISTSVLRQGLNKGMNFPVALLQAVTGTRPTLSEADIRRTQVLNSMFDLIAARARVFEQVRVGHKPRGIIAAYNKKVERIISSPKVDQDIREEFQDDLPIDTEQFLENKQTNYQSSAHTAKESERIRDILVNFKIEPKGIWEVSEELSTRLSNFTTIRRKLKSKVDDDSATVAESTKSVVMNGLQSRIGKISKAIAQADDPEKIEQLVDVVENLLSIAEKE